MLLASISNKPETLNGARLIKSYLFHLSHQWRGTDNINIEWDPTSIAFPFVLNPSPSALRDGYLGSLVSSCFHAEIIWLLVSTLVFPAVLLKNTG